MTIYTMKCGLMNIYNCDENDSHDYLIAMYNAGWKIICKDNSTNKYYQIIKVGNDKKHNFFIEKKVVKNILGELENRYKNFFDGLLEGTLAEKSSHNKGYVYILSNPYMPNILKIGKTKQTPKTRAKRLSQERGVIGEFEVEFQILVDDCDLVEALVHYELRDKRFNIDREFFDVDLEKAKQVILENKDKTIDNFKLDKDK